FRLSSLALLAYARADDQDLHTHLTSVLRTERLTWRYPTAWLLAWSGNAETGLSVLTPLGANAIGVSGLRGEVALARGAVPGAIEWLRADYMRAPDEGAANILRSAEGLAQALGRVGHLEEAAAVLERASHDPWRAGVYLAGFDWLRLRSELADLYRQMG